MKTGLKLLALALAGISLSACSTHHQTGSKDGIRDLVRSRGLGDVYKRQNEMNAGWSKFEFLVRS